MEQYLIDTNVVSDYFSASFPSDGMTFLDKVVDNVPKLSIITQIELLCWNTDVFTSENVKSFFDDSIILDISKDVVSYCVTLRKGKKIKTPDAIIAATALAYNYTLITKNEKDFIHINGIKIINPYTL